MKKTLLTILTITSLFADDADELLNGFDDDTPKVEVKQKKSEIKSNSDELLYGFDDSDTPKVKLKKPKKIVKKNKTNFTGRLSQGLRYSPSAPSYHDGLSSAPFSLFLEYNKEFSNGFKLKINAKDTIDFRYFSDKYTKEEKDEFKTELELYDFYLQGSLSENLDVKLGRQVVVWGKSDTIRVTDVINPLDNRRPGMTDIEDLRLPLGIVKFDYYVDEWHITPMVIVEQRWTKNPPFGSEFYPSPTKLPTQKEPKNSTYALNIGGEFSGYDMDFYLAKLYPQDVFGLPQVDKTKKANFAGASFNIVDGSWLFKSELAYFKDLKYLKFPTKDVKRTDLLVGFEYNGFSDTKISFDTVKRSFSNTPELVEKNSYQTALRVAKDFKNATVHANYLLVLNGKKLDKGGFQRAWIKYDIDDSWSSNFGVVDFIGGDSLTDKFKDNDIIFADITYHF